MIFSDFCNEIINNIYLLKKSDLDELKERLNASDYEVLKTLINKSHVSPKSVVNKKKLPPSSNPHDYLSISIYHWPNPNTIDGLPYIERDGIDNPEAIQGDKRALRELAYLTYLNGIMYYLTMEEKYLTVILKHNSYWFINHETKMNPHLNYAQHIPGVNTGEPGGIIDYAASYSYALNILNILRVEGLLPEDFCLEMQKWHHNFYKWLTISPQGLEIKSRLNNQGSLYDLLLLNILRFIDMEETQISYYYDKLLERIDVQINEHGLLPLELLRTKSKSYTTMGLKMLLESAYFLEDYGYSFKDNQKLSVAYKYIKPYYTQKTWDFTQIKEFDAYRGYYILLLFNKILKERIEIDFEDAKDHWGTIFIKNLFNGGNYNGNN